MIDNLAKVSDTKAITASVSAHDLDEADTRLIVVLGFLFLAFIAGVGLTLYWLFVDGAIG